MKMGKLVIPLLLILSMVGSVLAVDAGSVDISAPTAGSIVDLTDGTTIVIDANAGDEVLNCVITAPSLSTIVVNDTSGDTNFNYSWTPASTVKVGSSHTISVVCSNASITMNDSITVSIWDFATDDMASVASDVIGESGYQVKLWMPMIVLIFITSAGGLYLLRLRNQ